jgi:predicted dehydrogenase
MVRIGILGTSGIARLFFGGALQHAQFVAVASRDERRAREFASECGLARWHGSYDDLLADPHVDAVYIPLPNHLHASYTIRAARAGKHVLVEKPIALSAGELEGMVRACSQAGVLLMEAMMYRFKRIHQHVVRLAADGAIGDLQFADFSWCYTLRPRQREGFRLDPRAGGGALNDVGIYAADFLRMVLGQSLRPLQAFITHDERTGAETFVHALLGDGSVRGAMTCGYGMDANYYVLSGSRGLFQVPGSVSGRVKENVLRIHMTENDSWREEIFPPENPYHALLDHFAACIEGGERPRFSLEESLGNLKLIEEIRGMAAGGAGGGGAG